MKVKSLFNFLNLALICFRMYSFCTVSIGVKTTFGYSEYLAQSFNGIILPQIANSFEFTYFFVLRKAWNFFRISLASWLSQARPGFCRITLILPLSRSGFCRLAQDSVCRINILGKAGNRVLSAIQSPPRFQRLLLTELPRSPRLLPGT